MLVLTVDNLLDYVKEHYPAFDTTGPVKVAAVGADEDDSVGLINYLFRISNDKQSIIVKQGRSTIRLDDEGILSRPSSYIVPPERNFMEYTSMKLRGAITPQYAPKVYHADRENHIFLMEDVSYLKPSRNQLCKGIMIPEFGKHCGLFLAENHFYTSEFYMDTDEFRQFGKFFTNSGMRNIMENWVFLRQTPSGDYSDLTACAHPYIFDEETMAHTHMMRHKYMNCTQAFIHSDFHTGNIFAGSEGIKVIDMEYTFAGPCAYDLGYLLSHLISQYCTATFRAFPTPNERKAFKQYMLETIYELFDSYRTRFTQLWNEKAKDVYREVPLFRDMFLDEIVPDTGAYSCVITTAVAVSPFGFTQEFEIIDDEEYRRHALCLCCAIGRHLLVKRDTIHTPEDIISTILQLEQNYLRELIRY